MGLFDIFVSKNRIKWKEYISSLDARKSKDFQCLDIMFFNKDNIDFNKFNENNRANDTLKVIYSLNAWEEMNRPKKINCTPTYRSYYGDGYILRGRGSSQYDHTMDWFYIAYPDVAYFIYDNLKSLDEVILGKEAFYVKDGMLTLHFYRDMIDLYKSKGNILECAVDN